MLAVQDHGISVGSKAHLAMLAEYHWPLQNVDPEQTSQEISFQLFNTSGVDVAPAAGVRDRDIRDLEALPLL